MKCFIITPRTKKEEAFICELIKRMNFKAKIIHDSDIEDSAFAAMIEAGMKTESVSIEKSPYDAAFVKKINKSKKEFENGEFKALKTKYLCK